MRRGLGRSRARIAFALPCLALLAAAGMPARADAPPGPALHPGAIELGLAGAMTAIDGVARSSLEVRAGHYFAAGPLLLAAEPALAWTHVRALDVLDLELGISVQRRLGHRPLYLFAAAGAGVRQEWLGSFREARYPVGAGAGLRALLDARSAIRLEYRLRRVLDDPVSDFTEHHLLAGISFLFRNRP